jgi:DNA-binding LytR/AlgR family response regulator
LDRLALAKRGTLIALSVEDHYVRVRTDRGEAMVLMRLSDAIGETAPVKGLRVHRSHWVALDAVVAAKRRGDGAILTMAAGPEIPVSRANVAAIRDAGLLPRN